MTGQEVKEYLTATYGVCRHNPDYLAEAINQTQLDIDYENDWDLFRLLVENEPIPSLHTHSYGFHTANGRGIIEKIKSYYYEYENLEIYGE
tara:strand:+ start:2137 stop:2409 length:273 start_codon:yes stop_codon:yes gene_type:complete